MTVLLLTLLLAAAWAEQLPVGSKGGANTDVTDKARSGCEYPFEPVGNGCYFFSEEPRNIDGAKKACESLGHGYDVTLAMFEFDDNEDEAILTKAASKDKIFWVGASTEDGENWQWEDERPVYLQAPILDYREPNEVQNKCMVAEAIVGGNNKRAYLFDYGCEESMNFICQIGCPFEFRRIGRFCYFISEEEGLSKRTWQESRDFCETLPVPVGYHADLAVLGLDNQDNYKVMNNLVSGYSATTISWIGGIAETSCDYKWIDGRSISTNSPYWIYTEPSCNIDGRVYLNYDIGQNRTWIRDTSETSIQAFTCQLFKD